MTPDEWSKVKAGFEAALALEPSQRAAFLAQRCPEEGLRREVEKLLVNCQQAGGFLSSPVLYPHIPRPSRVSDLCSDGESSGLEAGSVQHTPTNTIGENNDPMTGQQMGVYKLVRRVGQGGMAAVFLAERTDGE